MPDKVDTSAVTGVSVYLHTCSCIFSEFLFISQTFCADVNFFLQKWEQDFPAIELCEVKFSYKALKEIKFSLKRDHFCGKLNIQLNLLIRHQGKLDIQLNLLIRDQGKSSAVDSILGKTNYSQ